MANKNSMRSTVLEENTFSVFDIIKSSNGITIDDITEKLKNKFFINGHISLEYLLETNVLIGRLEEKNSQFFITEKGEKYFKSLEHIQQ